MSLGWVRVGVRCVLVDRTNPLVAGSVAKTGDICIVLETRTIKGFLCVRVREENGKWSHGTREYAKASRYRPIITLEDDISMFTALTNMSPVERLDRLKEMMDQ